MVYKNPIKEAVKEKARSISASQDRKENSIKMSSACRDATQIIISYPEVLTNPEMAGKIKEKWLEWRSWFLERSEDKITDITEPFESSN